MKNENKKVERVNSRIGDLPIVYSDKVTVTVSGDQVAVKGPKGELEQKIPAGVELKIEDNTINVINATGTKKTKAAHGLMRALLNNMVIGVTEGFTKGLQIEGVGYRAAMKGSDLEVNVGYSNPVIYAVPSDVSIEVEQNTKVKVHGIDKARVGQVAAELRSIRPPEPYKGKGIRYENERIIRKVGKSGS